MPRYCLACVLTLLCLALATRAQSDPAGGPDQPSPAVPQAPKGTVPAGPQAPTPGPAPAPGPASTPAPAPVNALGANSPRQGSVRWIKGVPAAATAIRIRLRGAALSSVLDPAQTWELDAIAADGRAVALPAQLELPQPTAEPQRRTLPLVQHSELTAKDSWVIADRGVNPPPLTNLHISLVAGQYRQAVILEAADNLVSFSKVGQPALLFQALRDGDTVTFNDVSCPVGAQRYLRLTLPGGGALRIDTVEAWAEPARGATYPVTAALGPMRSDPLSGNSIWPLLVEDARWPLVRLKLTAAPAGDNQARNIRLVRLAKDGEIRSSATSRPWAQRLSGSGATRDDRWLDIAPEEQPEPRGIAVADGKAQPLQLKSVDAYAAEVCLTCSMPAAGELQLRLRPLAPGETPPLPSPVVPTPEPADSAVAAGAGDTAAATKLPGILIDGEITTLTPLVTPGPVPANRVAAKRQPGAPWRLPFKLPTWLPIVGYSVPGLLLLWMGVSLLRRPRIVD